MVSGDLPVTMSVAPETCSMVPSLDRKSTRLNSSHVAISYAVFCLKKKSADLGHAVQHADRARLRPGGGRAGDLHLRDDRPDHLLGRLRGPGPAEAQRGRLLLLHQP